MPRRTPARVRRGRPRPAPTGWRRVAFPLAALLLPVVCAGAVELALRAAAVGHSTDFLIRSPLADHYTTNPRYGWRFFPPALARTPLVAAVPASKDPQTYRLFVLGESAAMGIPEPAFGFSRVLEVMLAERYPDVRFEVINTAMTAINSHVIRAIARESARHRPDLFLVYMGNNEVVGPFGPATVFTGQVPGLPLIRARMLLMRTRTGQLLDRGIRGLVEAPASFSQWRGMEMLTGRQVPAGDPRLERTYRHFRRNLEDVLEAAAGAGAPVLLSTMVVNLRDNPPFGSRHGAELSEAAQARFEAARRRGAGQQAEGRHAEAAAAYREALAVDDGYAEAHYQLGEALLADGRAAAALEAFARARDLAVLRFRADSRINETIREAGRRATRDVVLVDAERLLADEIGGPPGDDLFWEHAHLNEAGNYLLARAFFEHVAPLLDARLGRRGDARAGVPSRDWCAERLALTEWDRLRMTSGIFDMIKNPPFTRQLGHEARVAARRRDLVALRERAQAGLDESEEVYRRAIAARPDDLLLRVSFAALLRERGRFANAAAQWRTLLERVPGVAEWQSQLAFALADQAGQTDPPDRGLLAEAETILREVLAGQGGVPAAHVNLGNVLERQGRVEEAMQAYRDALGRHAGHEVARFNLAALLVARGQLDEAARQYRDALALDPASAEAHGRLGAVLERQGRTAEALAEYRRALELDPDLTSIRNTLAYALERQGDVAEAIRHYRAALDSDPGYTRARLNLADLLMREGDAAAAARELREVLAREPDHPAALIGLALILATADAPHLRDGAQAVRLAERAVAVTGRSPETLRALATVRQYAQGPPPH
jgi:tetratricopeptide (TPR) repeat protein